MEQKITCRDRITRYFWDESRLFARQERLTEKTGYSKHTVKKALTQLRKEKVVVLYMRKYWGPGPELSAQGPSGARRHG